MAQLVSVLFFFSKHTYTCFFLKNFSFSEQILFIFSTHTVREMYPRLLAKKGRAHEVLAKEAVQKTKPLRTTQPWPGLRGTKEEW